MIKLNRLITRYLLVILYIFFHAVSPASPGSEIDEVTGESIRAAFLGQAERVSDLAEEQLSREKSSTTSTLSLSENIQLLSIASEKTLPTLKQSRRRLGPYASDTFTDSGLRLIRFTEPRQRFIEARKNRKYERTRRIFNGFVVPLSSLFQGQIFPLFAMPFNALDYLAVGKYYLSPAERAEYYLASKIADAESSSSIRRSASKMREEWDRRRLFLSGLHARLNGEKSYRQENEESSLFWFEREKRLRNRKENRREDHRELLKERARERRIRDNYVGISPTDSENLNSESFSSYTGILRSLMLRERQGDVNDLVRQFLIDSPRRQLEPTLMAATAAAAAKSNDKNVSIVYLNDLREQYSGTSWGERSKGLLERPDYGPANFLESSLDPSRQRLYDYLVKGKPPSVYFRSLTEEEARLSRSYWVDRLRALFFTDIIVRGITLPLLPDFPRPELIEASREVSDAFFQTPEGERWLQRILNALEADKRYQDAAFLARLYQMENEALNYDRKAAKFLEKIADQSPDRFEALNIYKTILNGYPNYRNRDRVQEKMDSTRRETETVMTIRKEELEFYPYLSSEAGLNLSPKLFDGKMDNGEVKDPGVQLLRSRAYAYTDSRTGNSVEVPLSEQNAQYIFSRMEPLRRSQSVEELLDEPLPRRKIPLAIEAGVFPGFNVSPTLLPLRESSQNRRLYE